MRDYLFKISAILKIRNWLILKLAGSSAVVINANIKDGGIYVEHKNGCYGLFQNVVVSRQIVFLRDGEKFIED